MSTNDDYLIDDDDELKGESARSYTPAPAGSHIARCVSIVFLGTQPQEYMGVEKAPRKEIEFKWELPYEMQTFNSDKGEQPFMVSKIYTIVCGEKTNWSKDMNAWTGTVIDENFKPLSMLGKPCNITVEQKESKNGKKSSKVVAVTGLPKGTTCPDRINELKLLTFGHWDEAIFQEQSEWIREKKIAMSPEYKRMNRALVPGNKEGKFQHELKDDLSNM